MKRSFLVGLSCVLLLSGCGNKEVEEIPVEQDIVQAEVVEPVEPNVVEPVEPEVVEPVEEVVEPEIIEPEIEETIVVEPVSFEIVPENNIVAGRGSLVFLHDSNLVGTDLATVLGKISAPIEVENFGTPLRIGVISMEEQVSLSGRKAEGKYLILEYFIYNNSDKNLQVMFDKMILHGYRDVNKPSEDYDAVTNSKGDFKIAPNAFVTYRVAFDVPINYDVIDWNGLDTPVLKPINMSILGLEEPSYEDVVVESASEVVEAETTGDATIEVVESENIVEESSESVVEQKLVIPSPISVTFNGASIDFNLINKNVGFQSSDYSRLNGLVKGRILETVSGFTGEDVYMNEVEKVALSYAEFLAVGDYESIEGLIYAPDTYISPITLFHKLEPIQCALNNSYPFTAQSNMKSYEVGNDLSKYTCYEAIIHYKNMYGESDMLELVVMKDSNGEYKIDLSKMFN